MHRAGAAADRTAAPVEELQPDAALASHPGKTRFRLVQGPVAREYPSILVAVAIAERHEEFARRPAVAAAAPMA